MGSVRLWQTEVTLGLLFPGSNERFLGRYGCVEFYASNTDCRSTCYANIESAVCLVLSENNEKETRMWIMVSSNCVNFELVM